MNENTLHHLKRQLFAIGRSIVENDEKAKDFMARADECKKGADKLRLIETDIKWLIEQHEQVQP